MFGADEGGGRQMLAQNTTNSPALINYYQAVLLLEAAFDEVLQHAPAVSLLGCDAFLANYWALMDLIDRLRIDCPQAYLLNVRQRIPTLCLEGLKFMRSNCCTRSLDDGSQFFDGGCRRWQMEM